MSNASSLIPQLSFFAFDQKSKHPNYPTKLWSPARSGNYMADSHIGRGYAKEFLDAVDAGADPFWLYGIILAMPRGKATSMTIEMAFIQAISRRLKLPRSAP